MACHTLITPYITILCVLDSANCKQRWAGRERKSRLIIMIIYASIEQNLFFSVSDSMKLMFFSPFSSLHRSLGPKCVLSKQKYLIQRRRNTRKNYMNIVLLFECIIVMFSTLCCFVVAFVSIIRNARGGVRVHTKNFASDIFARKNIEEQTKTAKKHASRQ